MNDRCRVFAISGEELFPCRWAKAKKLVKANVAEKITVDGKMCIKMLEPTRMNKPQEAIMENEQNKLYENIPECSFQQSNTLWVKANENKTNIIEENAIEENNSFTFPKIIYQFDPNGLRIISLISVVGDNLISLGKKYLSLDGSISINVKKENIVLYNLDNWDFDKFDCYPYRPTLSLAVSDFEYYKAYRIEQLLNELCNLEKTIYPNLKN